MTKTVLAAIVACASCTLSASGAIASTLVGVDDGHTTVSVRSFDPASARISPAVESANVEVADDMEWGGIETLDVPETESPAEQRAREQAERERSERLATRQAQTASRAATRTPVNLDSNAIIQEASKYLGVPYVYGGSSPSGFDCSGLVQYVYAQLGVSLPRADGAQHAWAQANARQVSAADAQPGDLMWMPGHVGIYAGDGMILHAPTPGDVVRVQSASYATFEYYRIG